MKEEARHILSLSGGKDSAALAIYLKDRVPDMEYVFNDTGKELPETYEYLDRIGDYLGRPVSRVSAPGGFDQWFQVYGGLIPSQQRRWCTRMLKLKPFEQYVGDDLVYSYIGLRADEDRQGYISHKKNIMPLFPFKEDGLVLDDIQHILKSSGVGMPPYTEWGRTRSGCFFCFYQQKIEWVNLLEKHPELYEEAVKYEKDDGDGVFTWAQGESLAALRMPTRVAEIKKEAAARAARQGRNVENVSLRKVFMMEHVQEAGDDEEGCLICSL